jgi:hypothetical protein
MHRQVHRTNVIPDLAGRRSMSLVARSKKALTSELYASQISYVAEENRPQAVVGEWSKQSPSTAKDMVNESPSIVRE